MSIDRLREELARIGDDAPVAEVPRETWSRAARARMRDRMLVLAAGAAAVALVAGLVSWLPQRDATPVASGEAVAAVPDRIYAVPARLAERGGEDESWTSDLVETDVAVGRAAAAYVMDEGLPVLIGADDGDYHLLDLPGFVGNDAFMSTAAADLGLALSPDGRRLAYAWATLGPEAASRRVPSGIRILDLETGDLREVPLGGGEGVLVTWIGWSPSGEWLVWRGARLASWTPASLGGSTEAGGRVAPGSTRSQAVQVPRGNALLSWAIGDDGRVVVVGDSHLLDLAPGAVEPSRVPLRVGATFTQHAELRGDDVLDLRVRVDAEGYVWFRHGRSPARGSVPSEVAGGDLAPLRWVDETHLLARAGDGGDLADDPTSGTDLVLLGVGDDASYDVVGTVEAGVPALSLATDLVTLERPTLERPAPDWPWTTTRWVLVGGGAILGLVVLATVVLLRQRRSAR
ncbi:hypothetical protein [Nocardioides sp. cx-173]|uniref:hypothetical protein n=1 Tax=Nocardioides sp. cx-173 TaxID=2898796 RepID=UPI001E2B8A74|nr:hypothetical protein [Nocardioides sp. cx-173]MCD4523419.1 hypothetical protein [Nocardioides sp. cx-173]UGB42242.1 hypothetical protein LQ940_01635 [Nocardioides sp. cx-173]